MRVKAKKHEKFTFRKIEAKPSNKEVAEIRWFRCSDIPSLKIPENFIEMSVSIKDNK